jgi:hypothetical protein
MLFRERETELVSLVQVKPFKRKSVMPALDYDLIQT